ncbi:hypothetical protein [Paenibacillus sp. ISL-20]|uniref:hypothetical protein n=1 Tax=Paenibacillus sp. ISL-20 TaxID=2819163 RepID=UPI001BE5D1EE|nr:hypothetical protein [Paenibacillus sp. ISL-20]MBT2760007.1 hypothetical protein [Paenibacillus sp. ISL-20]
MGKKVVIARLRPGKDDDIRKALKELPPYYDESDILREALRQFLFGHEGRPPTLIGSQVYSSQQPKEDDITLEKIEFDSDLDENLDGFIKE